MKKERLFYLDFIRALAAVLIVITHYNALFIYSYPDNMRSVIAYDFPFNIYIGDLGVSLFFVISGASLMYVYSDIFDINHFLKKRFKSLFPMFWFCYAIFFVYQFFEMGGIPVGIPRKNFILTVIGFDGYLNALGFNIPAFYIIGEWFLGAIILMYLVFPVLRYGIKEHPYLCVAFVLLVYIYGAFIYQGQLNKSCIITNRIPEMLFGMMFVEYRIDKKKIWNIIPFLSFIVLVINSIIKPSFSQTLQVTYVGITVFCVLVFIYKYIDFDFVKNTSQFIGKYSYAIFLVHHFLIYRITQKFDLSCITRTNSYILFLICLINIILVSYVVTYFYEKFLESVKKLFKDDEKL